MICRNCGHTKELHPAFLCHALIAVGETCRCPGWVEKKDGT